VSSGSLRSDTIDATQLTLVVAPPLQVGSVPFSCSRKQSLIGPPVHVPNLYDPTILVFDSGVGGLSVYREVMQARPDAKYVYVADDALFPYGAVEEDKLVARVLALMTELIAAHAPDLVVIACNTASTIVLPHLRRRFDLPFVGTVPAIKPACASSASKQVAVLGTQATVRREYTQALIREYGGGCQVVLVGSARLATFAERELAGDPVEDGLIAEEIAPCFVEKDGVRTDTVVLACTHYPFLLQRFERLAPWTVRWIDPAPAIARRVIELIGNATGGALDRPGVVIFTSRRAPTPALASALRTFKLAAPEAVEADASSLAAG
jgi:glutamate racemase